MQAPCGICKGKLGAIHYDEPSDSKHPLSFVIDEIIPISKWQQAGYNNASEAADDFNNLQAAHYICNQMKSDKIGFTLTGKQTINRRQSAENKKNIFLDGEW